MKVKVYVFWLGHFAIPKIEFESSLPVNYYIITIQNSFFERFDLYLTKSTNVFPIVFSHLARQGSGDFFKARKRMTCLVVKTNHPVERLSLNRLQRGSCQPS